MRRQQQGAATLLITVIIVLLVNILTYTMTRTTALENRMTAAEIRSKQAFHAAQAGLDFVFQQIVNNDLDELTNIDNCVPIPVDAAVDASPTFQLLYGAVDPECPSELVGLQTQSVIRSIGRSADGSAIRVLEVAIDLEREWLGTPVEADPSAIPPPTIPGAVVSRGDVTFAGTAAAAPCLTLAECESWARPGNILENLTTYDEIVVTAGGNINGGNTGNPDSRLREVHKNANDPGIAGSDPDDFFQDILGVDKASFFDAAQQVSAGDPLPEVNVNPLIWHDGDLRINGGVIGSPEKPVSLVVDGNLSLAGNVIVWGVVYTTGDLGFSGGTNKIFGALVSEQSIDLATGNAAVYFNDDLSQGPLIGGFTGEVSSELGGVQASFDSTTWREIFF
jgi:Tfp pilus assembly protein PilX